MVGQGTFGPFEAAQKAVIRSRFGYCQSRKVSVLQLSWGVWYNARQPKDSGIAGGQGQAYHMVLGKGSGAMGAHL